MSLMVKDKQLFKNYNKIWEKIESLMRKKFDSKLFYGNDDNKYIKTKIKTFKDSIITNFHNKKVPEQKIPCKCLSIIVLDFIIKTDNKYYPQTFQKNAYINNKNKNNKNSKRIILLKNNQNQIVALIMNQNQNQNQNQNRNQNQIVTLKILIMINKFRKK